MSDQQSLASTSRPGSPVAPLPDFSSAKPYRFTWDASTRKPGPASVSGASEGRGDYFAYRPTLGNFNFSSASLVQGAIPPDWSSARFGFNAISTLVNSPHKKSAPPKAHAAVPPVIPTQLPRVRRKDFDSYLKAITPDWEQFERTVLSNRDGNTQEEGFAARLARMNSDPSSTPRTPRFAQGSYAPPLESVPSVFLDTNFDLSEPRTFAAVAEQREGEEETLDPAALSHSLPLLERLSHYADTIELHLIREISVRSSSFFAALTNLNELQTESAQCLDRIRNLRGMLREVDEHGAKKGLQIVVKEKKLRNLADVREGVKTMQNVGEMFSLARNFANGGEWGAALSVVEGLKNMWEPDAIHQLPVAPVETKSNLKPGPRGNKRSSMLAAVPESIAEENTTEASNQPKAPPFALSSLKAFASLPEHLRALTVDIANSLTSELVIVLKTDLLTQIDSSPPDSNPSPKSSPEEAAERMERLSSLKDRLQPLVHGLKRTQTLRDSVLKWREVAMTEIKASVKRHLPSSEELDEEEMSVPSKGSSDRGAALRSQLRALSHEDFMSLLRTVYSTLLRGIQGIQAQNTAFGEVLHSSLQDSTFDISTIQTDLSDILSSTTELAHSRASKILSIRAEQHASLDLTSFLNVFSETWEFVIQTETICRRMVVGLRGAVVSQAKAFLQTMHQARITQSAKFVEEEQWSASEVSPSAQALANIIVESAMRDPPELVISSTSSKPLDLSNGNAKPSPSPTNATEPASASKYLAIEDRKYFAVSATLQMLDLLVDYLKVITNLTLLTTEAVGRIIEFLKAFNSRTCQVVLGAGAMRSAGLKNITAKHLALASQSLSIVIALIPYVRECFRRHLNPKQAVMLVEFDKLKRDYQEHQQEIHSKLVAIMGDRISAHCKSLQSVDWTVSRDGVNDYMVLLVKETVTLHKVLSRYLQDAVLEYIMSQVFAAMNHRLSEEYGKIELPNQESKDRLLRDVRYLHQNLSGLKNVNTPTGMLETVVSEKPVRSAPTEQSTPTRQAPQPSTPTVMTSAPSPPRPKTPQPHNQSTMESANERLKGIFRRSSMFVSPDSKEKVATPISPRFDSRPPVEKAQVQELEVPQPMSPPPPPTPEKQGLDNGVSSPSPMTSPPANGRRSPLPVDKDLPEPEPVLQEEPAANKPDEYSATKELPSVNPVTDDEPNRMKESSSTESNGHAVRSESPEPVEATSS